MNYLKYMYCEKHPYDGRVEGRDFPLQNYSCPECGGSVISIDFVSGQKLNGEKEYDPITTEALINYIAWLLDENGHAPESSLVRDIFYSLCQGLNDKDTASKLILEFERYLSRFDH